MMSNVIQLTRFAYLPDGTYGEMVFPNGEKFFTVERSWEGNKPNVSCIPDGTYRLGMRASSVVKRSSGGRHDEGWEVMDVPGRSYIMIHPGNWPKNFQGCIGVGRGMSIMKDSSGNLVHSVTSSRDAFMRMMEIMDEHTEWELVISPFIMEYP